MNSLQYTVRSIPPKVDQTLRARAQRTGKSLNTVVLEALTREAGVGGRPAVYDDLDWFIGRRRLDKKFDKAQEWLDSLPREL